MKLLKWSKDGGPDSTVSGLFIVESKSLFSVVLLKFSNGSRDAFHTHSFNAVSWLLKGELVEETIDSTINEYLPSVKPIYTPRDRFHKVTSIGDTWVLSFRGPWVKIWKEYLPANNEIVYLTNGRKIINE